MRRVTLLITLVLLVAATGAAPVLAQGGGTSTIAPADLTIFTPYPSQESAIGEAVTFKLTLRTAKDSQIAYLEMETLPPGWTAIFRGGSDIIHSAYVEPEHEASLNLQLNPPADQQGGDYQFVVVARGDHGVEAKLPLELMVQEKLPPNLDLGIDLPTIRGSAKSTFSYNLKLQNQGDEDLSVNLLAEAPPDFLVKFKLNGKEVTDIPVTANETKRITVEAKPFNEVAAGDYAIRILAQADETQADLTLTAEVTGQPEVKVTAPDGRLSGKAYAGKQTPLKLVVQNTGSAPAYNLALSTSAPSGWTVEFDPKAIPQLPAKQQVEVTAKVKPPEKAVTGDYMVTIRARPEGGATKSAEFRMTVLTSTWWGIVGIGLIAVAVIVVGGAVMRFGRR